MRNILITLFILITTSVMATTTYVLTDGIYQFTANPNGGWQTTTNATPTTPNEATHITGLTCNSNGLVVAMAAYDLSGTKGGTYLSTDAGTNWAISKATVSDTRQRSWKKVAMSYDATRLCVVGYYDAPWVFTSFDSGATWENDTFNHISSPCNDICMSTNGVYAFAATSIHIVRSDNGGRDFPSVGNTTWANQSTPAGINWTGICMDPNVGFTSLYASGDNTNLFSSTDSGSTWTRISSSPVGPWTDIKCTTNATKIIACQNIGFVYISTDSGSTWTSQVNLGQKAFTSVAISADGSQMACTVASGGTYATIDNGSHWSRIDNNVNRNYSCCLISQTNNILFAADGTEDVFKAIYNSQTLPYNPAFTLPLPSNPGVAGSVWTNSSGALQVSP